MRLESWFTINFRSRTLRIFVFFLPIYTLLLLYARAKGSRDPGSVFFDPWTGYDQSYSRARIEEGDSYIQKIDDLDDHDIHEIWKASEKPQLCVGIATVSRELKGKQYFRNTVGTLLDGLSEVERSQIYLIFFPAHSEPSDHPDFRQPWFNALPDRILLYNDSAEIDIDHIRTLEQNKESIGRQKALLDYQYLLRTCQDIGTPYTLMVEDDVIAQDGWFHKTQEAISAAESQTRQIGASKWLYLRLFYSEEFLGWKSEEWPIYLYYSVLIFSFVLFTCLGIRQYNPQSAITGGSIVLFSFIITPLLIILFFATGRVTVFPVPHGVHRMPDSGCCSQAFVFPQSRVPELLDLYHSQQAGYIDSITELYANNNNEIRWALTPSIMQHVGSQSTKDETGNLGRPSRFKSKDEMKGTERLWNFAFETNDVDRLREEHENAKEIYGY
ncbi:hypothetical protein N7456_001294 [Penicillium angulare]|uniref:Glycosyl transferase, family 54 n=1 Tax=Penicillium angulare TaxID=116970 RepID=A0A9W9GE47_9EURO|nr:hypothetical protein N7456_001294 [Penicillium angulare]